MKNSSSNTGIPAAMTMLLTAIILFFSCRQEYHPPIEIKGVYGHPGPLWEKGINLSDLGVNAIFVHSGSINQEMVEKARKDGLKVYAEFATLNGKGYVDAHPEAWAINEKGEQVEPATWFMGVCPTEPGFRQYRFDQLRKLLTKFDLDGVWMDYVHWHAQFEDPEPILPETCFCSQCLAEFSSSAGLNLPGGTTIEQAEWILTHHDASWRSWRAGVIFDWTSEFKRIMHSINPEVLLGLYHCPWADDEYDEARYRILGLDYDLLKQTVDVFSPMVYHGRMHRSPRWVEENIVWFSHKLKLEKNSSIKIWPIVQAHNDPGVISSEEFEIVLRGGLAGSSSGVMMFTTKAVAEDTGKVNVMRRVYSE